MSISFGGNISRRDFMCRMTLLGGAVAAVSFLPMSTVALADAVLQWGQVPRVDRGRDEALGNCPAYSEKVGFGRAHLVLANHSGITDTQLMV